MEKGVLCFSNSKKFPPNLKTTLSDFLDNISVLYTIIDSFIVAKYNIKVVQFFKLNHLKEENQPVCVCNHQNIYFYRDHPSGVVRLFLTSFSRFALSPTQNFDLSDFLDYENMKRKYKQSFSKKSFLHAQNPVRKIGKSADGGSL